MILSYLEGSASASESYNLFISASLLNKGANTPYKYSPICWSLSTLSCWSRYEYLILGNQVTLPVSGIRFFAIIFMNVDFPHPLGPTTTICSPSNILKLTLLYKSLSVYLKFIFSHSSNAIVQSSKQKRLYH